jgi:hypothetical protein
LKISELSTPPPQSFPLSKWSVSAGFLFRVWYRDASGNGYVAGSNLWLSTIPGEEGAMRWREVSVRLPGAPTLGPDGLDGYANVSKLDQALAGVPEGPFILGHEPRVVDFEGRDQFFQRWRNLLAEKAVST